MIDVTDLLSRDLSLSKALRRIMSLFPNRTIRGDWWQGEFHHDLMIGELNDGAKTLVLACN